VSITSHRIPVGKSHRVSDQSQSAVNNRS